MLKDNKGITLSALVITIIVLIIIASIATVSGMSSTNYIKFENAKAQFKVMQSEIDSLYSEYIDIKDATEKEKWKDNKFNGAIKYSEFTTVLDSTLVEKTLNGLTIDTTTQDEYIYLSVDFIKNNLKIDGISYDFIINLNERIVRLYGGVDYKDKTYYSAEDFGVETIEFNGIGKWFYKKDSNGRKTIVTNKKLELEIGDYINYSSTKGNDGNTIDEIVLKSNEGGPEDSENYTAKDVIVTEGNGYADQTFKSTGTTNKWKVLGVDEDKGELLIVSSDVVKTAENKSFIIKGATAYQYGINELDKICEIFGNGYGATGARSIRIEDINKITGYNPNNIGVYDPDNTRNGTKYNYDSSDYGEYGAKVKYSWTDTINKVKSEVNSTSDITLIDQYQKYGFNWYDDQENIWQYKKQDISNPEQIVELKNSYYYYFPDSLTAESDNITEVKGLDKSSKEYETIFNGTYWVASNSINTKKGMTDFCMRYVGNGSKGGYISSICLYNSYGYGTLSSEGIYIRPVVSLNSDVQLEKQDDGSYNIK